MIRIFKNTPLHSFLIAPALIFFLFVHNFHSVSFRSTLRSYFIAMTIACIFFLIFYFLLKKDRHKAGAVTTSLMLILFFYGLVYEAAEKLYYRGWWPFNEIHRYIVFIILALVLWLCYFLFRTKRTFQSLTFALNVFVMILFVMNLFRLIMVSFSVQTINQQTGIKIAPANDTMPDIYYIILDGYASDSTLASIYSYPENSLTRFLKEKNFFIAGESRANYLSTLPSLSSSLNFIYVDDTKQNLIRSNEVSRILKSRGYRIVHVRTGYQVTKENAYADVFITLDNLSEFERALLQHTVFRLDDLLGYARYKSLKEQLRVMHRAIVEQSPKFVFLHIVSPHPPFVCDEEGNFKTSPRVVNVWWEPKEDYLLQLKYINREIQHYISEVFRQSMVKPVILLQSDHGPWIQASAFKEIYDARSRILNAYYIPYEWRKNMYDSMTPVNSFRVIFNGLFGDELPLLPDVPVDSASVKKSMNVNLYHQQEN